MDWLILIVILIVLVEVTFLVANGAQEIKMKGQRRKIYVDTSALIDGRILLVAQTGFMSDNLIVPRSVVRELQLLADGKDIDKRFRARRGMEVVNELERVVHCDVMIYKDKLDRTPVDERLIELAHANHGMICTTDFNLAKVAETEGIEVLNVNDLAVALREDYLPGEKIRVKITEKGQNAGQGVGHLADGTMVIVDNGGNRLGTDVEVDVLRFIQTERGRMLFAKAKKGKKKD